MFSCSFADLNGQILCCRLQYKLHFIIYVVCPKRCRVVLIKMKVCCSTIAC